MVYTDLGLELIVLIVCHRQALLRVIFPCEDFRVIAPIGAGRYGHIRFLQLTHATDHLAAVRGNSIQINRHIFGNHRSAGFRDVNHALIPLRLFGENLIGVRFIRNNGLQKGSVAVGVRIGLSILRTGLQQKVLVLHPFPRVV